MSLNKKAQSGYRWTAGTMLYKTSLHLIELVVLAFFLTPSDIGIIAIIRFIIGISFNFMDMGISPAIIHFDNIKKTELNCLFLLNILMGIFAFILLFSLSNFIAGFYNEEDLAHYLKLTSIVFPIQSIGLQRAVLLKKELKFKVLGKIELIGLSISFISMMGFLFMDFEVFSVIYSNIVLVSVMTFLLMRDSWKSISFEIDKFNGIRRYFKFGLYQSGEKFLNYFNKEFDTLLIGKILGMDALGFYSIAKSIAMRPSQIINPVFTKVSFPLMAKFSRRKSMLRRIYLKILSIVNSINFPLQFILILFAHSLVFLFFGAKWSSSIIILQIISAIYLIRSTGNPSGSLLMATGNVERSFYWNLVKLTILPLTIYIGSFWGIIGVTVSMLVFQILIIVPVWMFLYKNTIDLKFLPYIQTLFKPLLLSSIPIIILIPLYYLFDYTKPLFLSFSVLYLAIVFGMYVKFEKQIINDILSIFKIKKRIKI